MVAWLELAALDGDDFGASVTGSLKPKFQGKYKAKLLLDKHLSAD